MKNSRTTAIKVLAIALALLLAPAMALGDGFLDNDLWYIFEWGSETEVSVDGLRNSYATNITIPATVVYEYIDGKDEDGNDIVKRRKCRVKRIQDSAFRDCRSLTRATIGDGVTSIGGKAFSGCSSLERVTIGDSVTYIGAFAFEDCSSLERVTIPDSVTDIGGLAFSGCNDLASVTILGNVTNDWSGGPLDITYGPFSGCTHRATLVLGEKMTKIGANMFACFTGLTAVTIPDSVTSIGEEAFKYCNSLASVTIGDSVTYIGAFAFEDCSSLERVTILGNVTNDWVYETRPFYDCTNLSTLVLGGKMTKIGNYMFFDCPDLTCEAIPDSVTSIGDSAFSYCGGLTNVTIPDNVTRIGDGAFFRCGSLTNVVVLGNVTNDWGQDSIGNYHRPPFCECTNLSSFVLGEKMTKIGSYMFDGFIGLTSLTILGNVTNDWSYL